MKKDKTFWFELGSTVDSIVEVMEDPPFRRAE